MRQPSEIIYRWDLDKTYLRTEFDSLADLVRTAAEPVDRKRTVPGAATLLREQSASQPRGVHILSGSPEQMRRVLEAKLRQDGIRWDTFTLKPSLRNLLRGRFRFVRDQVGYKLGVLVASRKALSAAEPAGVREILFGDDAEADAFVYSLYADLCAGRVSISLLEQILDEANLYPDQRDVICATAAMLPTQDVVRLIFIHLDRVSPVSWFRPYGRAVCPIHNYFQSACALVELGALPAEASLRVGAELLGGFAFGPDALLASILEIASRGHLGRAAAASVVRAAGSLPPSFPSYRLLCSFGEALEERLPDLDDHPPPPDREPIDYLSLYRRDRAGRRALRARIRFRR